MTTTQPIYPPIASIPRKPATMTNQIIAANIPLFRQIPADQLATILADCQTRHYRQGDIIFHEGDPGTVLYLISAGQIRIYVNSLDGSETSVVLFGRTGDIFGELAVIDGMPRSATAVALTATTLAIMNRDTFRRHMQNCPQLGLNFMRELSQRVRYNTRQMDSLVTLGISQRLARKLLHLAQDYGTTSDIGVAIDLSLTQSDLASLVGATRESVNKTLRDFRDKQWVFLKNGRLHILDPDALRAHVNS